MFNKHVAKDIAGRVAALFIMSSLTIISGSAVLNSISSDVSMPIWYSAALGGFMAVADVITKLAKASLDGKLEAHEVDEAFGIKRDKHPQPEA